MEGAASGSQSRSQLWSKFYQREQLNFSHYSVPEHNLQSEAGLGLTRSYAFPYKCTHHLPYTPPNPLDNIGAGLYHGDPATFLVHKKAQWTNQIDSLVRRNKQYEQAYSSISEAIKYNSNEVTMPHHMAHFMQLLSQDPDSNFSGVTNWYYTGGRLGKLVIEDQLILLTTSGCKNDELYGIPLKFLSKKGWQPDLDSAVTMTLPDNDVIYEIIGKYTHKLSLIGTRQRNVCTIYTLEPTESCLKLQGAHQATSDRPLTSIDISEHNVGQYCTLSTNRQVSLWDALSCACITSDLVEKPKYDLSNSWCSIQFLNDHMLMLADTSSINFLDTRKDLKTPCMVFYPRDQPALLNYCEDISQVIPSTSSPSNFYISTSHHLLELDARAFKTTQRWTHMMRSPPIYSEAMAGHNSEIICIANQEPAEVVVIVNNVGESNGAASTHSPLLPFLLPTLRETLGQKHMHGQLLDPRVQRRLKVSLTGLMCLPVENGVHHQVLLQTSLGDIFVQKLHAEENEAGSQFYSTPEQTDIFSKWECKALEASVSPMLKVTERSTFAKSYNNIMNPNFTLETYSVQPTLQQSLQSSESDLVSYVDVLAPELLSAWDIEKMAGWGNESEEIEESGCEVVDCTLIDEDNDDDDETTFFDTSHVVEQVSLEGDLFRSETTVDQVEVVPESGDNLELKDSNVSQNKSNLGNKSLHLTPRRKSQVFGF